MRCRGGRGATVTRELGAAYEMSDLAELLWRRSRQRWTRLAWTISASTTERGRAGRHWLAEGGWQRAHLVLRKIALHGRALPVRLAVIVLPLVVVAAALGLLRVQAAVDSTRPLAGAAAHAAVSRAAVAVTEALQDERDLTAQSLAADRASIGLPGAYARTTRALAALDATLTDVTDASLRFSQDELRTRLRSLDALRTNGFTDALSPLQTIAGYSSVILVAAQLGRTADSRAVLLSGDTAVIGRSAGTYELVIAAGVASQRRALVTAVLSRGVPSGGELKALGVYDTLIDVQTGSFRAAAGPSALRLFQAANVEAAAGEVDRLVQELSQRGSGPDAVGLPVAPWTERSTLHLTKLRQVVRAATDGVAADIGALRSERTRQLWWDLTLVLATLIGALLLAAVIGHGLASDLRQLRDRMRTVAEERLPQLIDSLAEVGPVRPGHADPPAAVTGAPAASGASAPRTDEIGEVAAAFEAVHQQAVRLATAQADLRATTAALTRTLAGRTQELVGRQLALITELEQPEVDPGNLDRFFELDHLATRIRRYGDSLLVLTGGSPGWRWPHSATLQEVVQAAAAATEQYRRVEIGPAVSADVPADVVVNLMQILAELIDNATRFSDPDAGAHVVSERVTGGHLRIEVRNIGHGFGSRTAAELNARLAHPAIGGLGDEQTLGLHVVGALAARIGVAVELVPVPRGCVAVVTVPGHLLSERVADPVEPAGLALANRFRSLAQPVGVR